MFVPHASEIWTKSYGPSYTKFWASWQKKKKKKKKNTFLTKPWRYFGRRFCSWNNCLMLVYQFPEHHLSVFQKLRLKVATNMANLFSIKNSDSRLKVLSLHILIICCLYYNMLFSKNIINKICFFINLCIFPLKCESLPTPCIQG